MFAIFAVVFRELLEVIFILNLVLVATAEIPTRTKYIITGLLIGILGSSILTYYSGSIDTMADGMGQELVNGLTLAFTALMIATAIIWINKNASQTSTKIKNISYNITVGTKSIKSLVWLVAFLIFREGSELGIYLTSIIRTHSYPLSEILLSVLLGVLSVSLVSFIFYKTSLIFLRKYIFKLTNFLLILVACSLASQAANFFIAAGILPELINNFWDSSQFISLNSTLGKTLNILIGYDDRPTLMSFLFYIITFIIIISGIKFSNKTFKHS
ncbi:FTR1 family protein [Rickettsiales endosymbiont of Stachyamoeba lipophora]|uniref:FTR1 family protein n=1 Tax=Rickettsiales endosymbiont of Stachyamoeba lipophora TaxID=2486578 RepID=UPI000F653942|nr:FTR1 family protein [Rickettsiales endosymbiont of Stachyamoeba lipophora]AZL15638.1 hypothetical protein EF513_03625 [Rickettsiales endosymbiont of Stachyamoeba lipophora]